MRTRGPPHPHVVLAALALTAALGVLLMRAPAAEPFQNETSRETIFVSVASYRDDDCSQTLRSMFQQAARPDRVYAGVCQQNKAGETKEECVDPLMPWRRNVRVITVPHTAAKGPTYARYLCASLYDGETYFLQIDSHTQFQQGWDQHVIEDLKKCPSARAVLSYYPHDSKSDASAKTSTVPVLCKSKFNPDNIVTFEAVSMEASRTTPKPIPFVAGGFMFGPGQMVREVPFDPTLEHLFHGEEILYSARLWTSGYDMFAPLRNVAFHYYTRSDKPKFWGDIQNYHETQKRSQDRVVRLLGLDGQPAEAAGAYKYGMGSARTLAQYLAFAGLDPSRKTSVSEQKFCT